MRREMKRFEDLGCSPAPWSNTVGTEKPFETNSVWDARNGGILTGGYAESLNDARLIAAAPELYEALRGLLEIVCGDCNSAYKVDGKCVKCPRVVAAEAALEKAGGAE